MNKNYFIGMMSGTSLDAIDCGLFSTVNNFFVLEEHYTLPYPARLREKILSLCQNKSTTISEVGLIETELSECYAKAVLALLKKANLSPEKIIAIGNHGQTVYHSPEGVHPFTMQLGNSNIIAARTQIDTVSDFRRMDMAYGGQGAPLAPAFHAACFSSPHEKRGILNIGGMSNITFLAKDYPVLGFDISAGNVLMDAWIQTHLNKPFDENGQWAKSGKCHDVLLSQLMQEPYLKLPIPKSTGRELFNLAWLNQHLQQLDEIILPQDVQTTLCEFTARCIQESMMRFLPSSIDSLYIYGGGANNIYLLERLTCLLPLIKISTTAELGISPGWVEAATFAWLAKQRVENKPGNLVCVTGADRAAVLGAVYSKRI